MHDRENPQAEYRGSGPSGRFLGSRTFFVFLGFLAIALVMLFSEHRAHFLGYLPLLFLLACPLLHVFGHGHHGGHGSRDQERSKTSPGSKEKIQ